MVNKTTSKFLPEFPFDREFGGENQSSEAVEKHKVMYLFYFTFYLGKMSVL